MAVLTKENTVSPESFLTGSFPDTEGVTIHVSGEVSEACEALILSDARLAKALQFDSDYFFQGNESLVFKLNEVGSMSLIQEYCASWLTDSAERIKALLKDWPEQSEAENLLHLSSDEQKKIIREFLPDTMILKFVKPDSGTWSSDWGLRPQDAACFFQTELSGGWYLYFQEELEMTTARPFLEDGFEFIDGAPNAQCGCNHSGHIRIADYGAVGQVGSGDDVLADPKETSTKFDEFCFRHEQKSGNEHELHEVDNLDLEDAFPDPLERRIAESLINEMSGNSIPEDAIEQEIACHSIISGEPEEVCRTLVLSIAERLQTSQGTAKA